MQISKLVILVLFFFYMFKKNVFFKIKRIYKYVYLKKKETFFPFIMLI